MDGADALNPWNRALARAWDLEENGAEEHCIVHRKRVLDKRREKRVGGPKYVNWNVVNRPCVGNAVDRAVVCGGQFCGTRLWLGGHQFC
eukprot:3929969-Rhodomonas_salina.3